MRWIFDRVALESGMSVLDVGAGTGILWAENLERIPSGLHVVLSDFSRGMVNEARRALGGDGCFRFVHADAQAIPHPTHHFDCVFANHMLYHVPDRPAALAEIARVLRPGGTLYATSLGATHLQELGDILREAIGDTRYWGARSSASFQLDNGPPQLEPFFRGVAVERYADGLRVTEAAPLIAYLLSMPRPTPIAPEQVDALRSYLESRIARHGEIRITKDCGLITARSPSLESAS
ncbi:MAG: class I SAM-dependent methyltransferase [Proteobacteria bacterium]|nr:class I SAM-dependent methyltransferase [Pseudomonadota bacterium]